MRIFLLYVLNNAPKRYVQAYLEPVSSQSIDNRHDGVWGSGVVRQSKKNFQRQPYADVRYARLCGCCGRSPSRIFARLPICRTLYCSSRCNSSHQNPRSRFVSPLFSSSLHNRQTPTCGLV